MTKVIQSGKVWSTGRNLGSLTPKTERSITTPKSRRMDLEQKEYISKVGPPGRVKGPGAGERLSPELQRPRSLVSSGGHHAIPSHTAL